MLQSEFLVAVSYNHHDVEHSSSRLSSSFDIEDWYKHNDCTMAEK